MTKLKIINYQQRHLKEIIILLNELSPTPNYVDNRGQFAYIHGQRRLNKCFKTFVAKLGKEIIGIASVIIEPKYYHNFKSLCHIEDVVIKKKYRGKGYGRTILKHCIEYAKKQGCYRALLICTNENVEFYQKTGFCRHVNLMRYDI